MGWLIAQPQYRPYRVPWLNGKTCSSSGTFCADENVREVKTKSILIEPCRKHNNPAKRAQVLIGSFAHAGSFWEGARESWMGSRAKSCSQKCCWSKCDGRLLAHLLETSCSWRNWSGRKGNSRTWRGEITSRERHSMTLCSFGLWRTPYLL